MRHAILAAAAFALVGTPAFAADLLRPYHHHYRHHRAADGSLAIFRGDRSCPRDEPSNYRPRTVNFNEPLCYAARPYGISEHLYDHSTLLDVYRTDEYESGY